MSFLPNRINGQSLEVRDIFFRRLSLSMREIREMSRIFYQPLVLFFLGLIIAVFLILDQAQLLMTLSIWRAGLIWMAATVLQIILFGVICIVYAQLQSRFQIPVLYLPLVSLISFCLNFPLTTLHISLHAGLSYAESYDARVFWSALALSFMFEALYFSFVFPLLRATRSFAIQPPNRHINVAGEAIDIEQILILKGQEHYVLVMTQNGSRKLRARLCDMVSQMNEEDGILAHRSHWISRRAIKGVTCENGIEFILTNSGERMPIARPRQAQVRDWMRKYATETT